MADLTPRQVEDAVDTANKKERDRRSRDAIKGIFIGIPLAIVLFFALGK